jgi:glycine hydroxymethyltransferase
MILCNAEFAKRINSSVFPGNQGGPLMHVIAGKAVAFGEALKPEFKEYAKRIRINAATLAEDLTNQGVKLVSGGTDNHLMLVDLTPIGITGSLAEKALDRAGITVNKNAIPYDKQPPTKTSGIRVGTPAVTTRGMGVEEMKRIGNWMGQILRNPKDEDLQQRIAGEVRDLCANFPAPGHEGYDKV